MKSKSNFRLLTGIGGEEVFINMEYISLVYWDRDMGASRVYVRDSSFLIKESPKDVLSGLS